MRPYGLYLFLCLQFLMSSVTAQPLPFSQPVTPESFFESTPLSITQDQQGFLWIGTTDGLGRYDGKEVIEFKNLSNDSSSISNNYIRILHTDREGNIWVGTKRGLNCFHPETGTFTRYFHESEDDFESENNILSIDQDHMGYIWYGTYNGLFRLDPKDKTTLQWLPDPENPNAILDKIIFSVFEDSRQRLWVGSYKGLSLYQNNGNNEFSFENYNYQDDNSYGLKSSIISCIAEQPNGNIWFGSYDGIYKVIEQDDGLSFREYLIDPDYSKDIASNNINHILVQDNQKLWLSTYNQGLGELSFSEEQEEPISIQLHQAQNSENTLGFTGSSVKSSFIDKSGNLWVLGSEGIQKLSLAAPKFNSITPDKDKPRGLQDNVVLSVYKDRSGDLWVGTREGLHFLSADNLSNKTYNFQVFRHDKQNKESLSHNKVYDIYEDSQGLLWFSTFYGLNYIDPSSFNHQSPVFNKITTKDGLPNNWVFNIEEIKKGEYLISTYGKLSKMNFIPGEDQKAVFRNYDMNDKRDDALVNATTYQTATDQYGYHWVATYSGLSRMMSAEAEGVFDNYKMDHKDPSSLSDNSVISLFKDSKNRFWVGTRNGLNLVIQNAPNERASFKKFGFQDGLSNTVIQTIQEDSQGHLWLGTNKGLFEFDPDRADIGQKAVIRVFKKEDGLSNSNVVFRASAIDEAGNIFLGTANGVNYFHPSNLSRNQQLPEVVFTHLKVLNTEVFPSADEEAILQKSITKTNSLLFSHRQNFITIEFAALEFSQPPRNQYAHQLVGLNDDWIYSGTDNSVTYTNLSPGQYTLKVKACNNDGVWNETPKELSIRILPPPWKTWWAYTLYAVIGLVALYLGFLYFSQRRLQKVREEIRINQARYEERELLRKKNAADFHDELGHRLTKISLFTELAERQATEHQQLNAFISKIKNNTRELSDGVKDLIWSLDPSQDTLLKTLARLQEFGDRLFDFTDIKFKTEKIAEDLDQYIIDADKRKQILLIFKEAMNNCLKYSKAKNAILQTQLTGDQLQITFKDDGVGMNPTKQPGGYGLKNMQQRANQIDGSLQIISEINHGCTIQLQIKIPHMG